MKCLGFTLFSIVLLMAGLVSAQSSFTRVKEELIFQDVPFAQCHASTLLETSNGEILAAWFGGTQEGNKDVKIWISKNQNRKWSYPLEFANGNFGIKGAFPLWNPVLFKNSEDTIFLFYKAGPNPREWWGMYKTSADQGKTWSDAVRLPEGILGPIKNKPIWCNSTQYSDISRRKASDSLQKSTKGNVIESWSDDYGLTWSKMRRTSLLNPNSGNDVVTLKSGSQLISPI